MSILVQVTDQLSADLKRVETQIRSALMSTRYQVSLRESLGYLLQKPGKRLRPILTILSYRSNCPSGPLPTSVILLAAAIELIHMASLIHDDIIDSAELRHGQVSFHQQYGVEVAIPVGVLLYSVSLQLLAKIGNLSIIKQVSRAVEHLCSGELTQVMRRDQFDLAVVDYLIILKKKTSALFALSAWGGAVLANAPASAALNFRKFGNNLGLLYQISDDMLDVLGDSDTLQKGANQDFILGEMTLPFIYLVQLAPDGEKAEIVRVLRDRDQSRLPWLLGQLRVYRIDDRCRQLVTHYEGQCNDILNGVIENQFVALLTGVLHYISDRARF